MIVRHINCGHPEYNPIYLGELANPVSVHLPQFRLSVCLRDTRRPPRPRRYMRHVVELETGAEGEAWITSGVGLAIVGLEWKPECHDRRMRVLSELVVPRPKP